MLSTTLNNALPIQDVLRECGTAVRSVPGVCRCPVCGRQTLYATRAGDEAGGWYQCQGPCRFAGDSVALLAARERQTVENFIRSRRLRDADLYRPDNITSHVGEMRLREDMRNAWRRVSRPAELLAGAPPEVRELMARTRLLPRLQSLFWSPGADQRFGACSNQQARECMPGAGANPFPGTKHKPWIVTPVHAAPGLMTGFAAFDDTPGPTHFFFPHAADRDGLMFLDRPIGASVEVAFAFDSVRHAMALHLLSQSGLAEQPPPIVCYSEHTDTAWRHVQSRKVVFWAPEVDIDLLTQARRLGDRAHVARWTLPAGAPDPNEHFRGETCNMALHRLESVAQPWLRVLKDFVLNCARSAVADQLPLKIRLTPAELERLLGYCATPEERRLFGSVYDTGHVDVSIRTSDNRTVVQKSDGWYRAAADGSHVLVSSAMPVVERVTPGAWRNQRGETVDTALASGHIRIGHQDPAKQVTVPFRNLPRQLLTRDWISDACLRAGHFITAWAAPGTWYWDVATAFHAPTVVPGLDRIGWDRGTAAFRFANCSVVANGLLDESPLATPEPHPTDRFAGKMPVRDELVREWFRDNRYANFWRVYLGGLYCVLAPAAGRAPIAVGVYCTDATDVVAAAAAALYGETAATAERAKSAAGRHGVPVWAPRSDGPALPAELLRTRDLANVVADLGTEENAHLAQLLGWYVVACSGPVEVPDGADTLLAAALAQHQRDPADPGLPPFRFALETVRAWLARAFEHPAPGTRGLLQAVSGPDPTPAGAGRRLLGIVRLLVRAGELPLQRSSGQLSDLLPSRTTAVQQGDTVCVPVEGLARALRRTRLPFAVSPDAAAELAAAGALAGTVSSLGSVVGWRVPAAML